jgi:glycerophosphoryl diester phosphodiesterase
MRRLASWLLAVSLLPPFAELGSGAGPAPRVAAHRGGALLWPENSLLAFRNALALGADLLEIDVHLTADGEVVVIHDPTLERTTTGRGAVREQRLADLASLRLRARDGTVTGERVPSLGEVLDLLAPSRAELLLEVKVDDGKRRYAGIEEKLLAALRQRGLAGRTFVMAFEAPTIARIRQLDPDIRTVLLVARGQLERSRTTADEVVRWAGDVKATALGIDHRAVDAQVVAAARRAGLMLATWTVNAEADIRHVIGLGVDIVISDRPDLALRLGGR